jgi:hypothetical protein
LSRAFSRYFEKKIQKKSKTGVDKEKNAFMVTAIYIEI